MACLDVPCSDGNGGVYLVDGWIRCKQTVPNDTIAVVTFPKTLRYVVLDWFISIDYYGILFPDGKSLLFRHHKGSVTQDLCFNLNAVIPYIS